MATMAVMVVANRPGFQSITGWHSYCQNNAYGDDDDDGAGARRSLVIINNLQTRRSDHHHVTRFHGVEMFEICPQRHHACSPVSMGTSLGWQDVRVHRIG